MSCLCKWAWAAALLKHYRNGSNMCERLERQMGICWKNRLHLCGRWLQEGGTDLLLSLTEVLLFIHSSVEVYKQKWGNYIDPRIHVTWRAGCEEEGRREIAIHRHVSKRWSYLNLVHVMRAGCGQEGCGEIAIHRHKGKRWSYLNLVKLSCEQLIFSCMEPPSSGLTISLGSFENMSQ